MVVIEAPYNLGLKPPAPGVEPGTREAPRALKEAGLLEALGVTESVVVDAPPYRPERDPATGIRNTAEIRAYMPRIADAVGEALDGGEFPVVIGGDCSLLLGSMLALRRRGTYGLAYIDGHAELLTPGTSETGGAAGMALALAAGQGPGILADLEGLRPLVRGEHAVIVANRDFEAGNPYPEPEAAALGIGVIPLGAVRAKGVTATVHDLLEQFDAASLDGFWIHVDVDVLDSTVMPAVDSSQPDGLSVEELAALVRGLRASPLAVGMQVTIFDPTLDPGGALARTIVGMLRTSRPL